jgi:putative peptidoglycan lipid II flippase
MGSVTGEDRRHNTGWHAFLVGAGILLSRLMGLVRQRAFSHFFGLRSDAADAFMASIRIPNFLQNLFGEGVLSASFIPVYARLLAEGDEKESRRVAGAIGALISLVISILVLIGVLATPLFIDVIAPGFHGPKRALTITIVRILFPGAGLLVLSAWCLGILNSHRKFFVSYTAPVIWNLAMIGTLITFGRRLAEPSLAVTLAWGSVIGSALQVGVQLPQVLRLVRHLRLRLETKSRHVRDVVRNFIPVFISRGVVQISAYVDTLLASFLPTGAVTGLMNAQTLYLLPVSLFGMSVSAAELPAMSSALGDEAGVAAILRTRVNEGLRRIAFFIVPSAMAFLALGSVIAGALFQTGKFRAQDSSYVWGILAGSAIGLVASTLGRLYSSAYYALRDTRTPLLFAVVRVLFTSGLGYVFALPLPIWIGISPRWGVAGLTASAGLSGWVEFTLLRRTMNRRIGATGLPSVLLGKLWFAAAMAAAAAWGIKLIVVRHGLIFQAVTVLGVYGLVYFALTYLLRVEECARLLHLPSLKITPLK